MEKFYEIEEILSRLKFAIKAGTWKDVAAFLGEKEGTVSAWKKNNRQGVIEKILYKSRGVATERWLLTGEGPMAPPVVPGGADAVARIVRDAIVATHERQEARVRRNEQRQVATASHPPASPPSPTTTTVSPHHPSGSDPPQCPPPDQEEDDKLPTPLQAIEMTKSVLASRTIYRGALLQNIKAFHKAVRGKQRWDR